MSSRLARRTRWATAWLAVRWATAWLAVRWATAWLAVVCTTAAWAETLRDPTEPPLHAGSMIVEDLSAPRLSSILISADRRLAVIDGERLQVGDLFAGGEVVAIEATEVTVEGPDGPSTLSLYRVPVRKRTPGEE